MIPSMTMMIAISKQFVLAQKLNLIYENHLLVWHKKFGTGTICKSVFGMAQKIWTSPKHFKDILEMKRTALLPIRWTKMWSIVK